LLDTGSGITVAGSALAEELKWEVFPPDITLVKAANGGDMFLHGVAHVTLRVGTQDIDTEILISPNMTGLILGSDWMEKNECVFDCKRKQVCVNDEWIALKREPVDRRIGGTYVTATTQFSASSVDRVAKTNTQFFAHNAVRIDKSTHTNSRPTNFVNNISPSQGDASLRPRRMTDTFDTFTDTTTFSDTSPPWVNISNDRAHLQKECPGWNAAIPSWSDISDNISSSLVDVSQRPGRMTDTFTNVSPSLVDVPGARVHLQVERPKRMTDTFTDVPPPLVDVPGGRKHSQDERRARNMNILGWDRGYVKRERIRKRRRTNSVQTESGTAPAVHPIPSLNHTTRYTNPRPQMTITNSRMILPASHSTIELKGRGSELGIDEFVRLNF